MRCGHLYSKVLSGLFSAVVSGDEA